MERPWRVKLTNHSIDNKAAGRSKAHAPCKKHPKHRQSPGVCSVCLNEKLSHIINSADSKPARSPSSSSSSSSYASSLSSSDVSSCSSPASRVDSEGRRQVRAFTKSRSMAFVPRRGDEEIIGRRIKGGFWSKLLPKRSGKLMHSRTMMVERVAVAAVH